MNPTKPNDKWTAYDPPNVIEDGQSMGRYRVESQSAATGWHLVDLTDRGGHGTCSCHDFQYTANPNFLRVGEWIPYAPNREGRSDCKHLEAAKAHFHLHVTVPMLASFADGIPTNQPS
jgi:hypothetical protein